jgi:hypothetical protein
MEEDRIEVENKKRRNSLKIRKRNILSIFVLFRKPWRHDNGLFLNDLDLEV